MQGLSGARQPRWIFTLLDGRGRAVRRLRGVSDFTVEVSANSRLGVSGSIELAARVSVLETQVLAAELREKQRLPRACSRSLRVCWLFQAASKRKGEGACWCF